MTIRFAAARNSQYFATIRSHRRCRGGVAANDNASSEEADALVHRALHMLGAHGFRAGKIARDEAKNAFFAGDREGYDRWRRICAMLDRHAARELARDTRIAETAG